MEMFFFCTLKISAIYAELNTNFKILRLTLKLFDCSRFDKNIAINYEKWKYSHKGLNAPKYKEIKF